MGDAVRCDVGAVLCFTSDPLPADLPEKQQRMAQDLVRDPAEPQDFRLPHLFLL